MKTAEEVLNGYENSTDHLADQDYVKESVIAAMEEYARLVQEEQIKICLKSLDELSYLDTLNFDPEVFKDRVERVLK